MLKGRHRPTIKKLVKTLTAVVLVIVLLNLVNVSNQTTENEANYYAGAITLAVEQEETLAMEEETLMMKYNVNQDWVYPLHLPFKQSIKAINNTATSKFPTCQSKHWCDGWFSLNETLTVQRWIYEMQNPVDCNSSRLLIVAGFWNAGIGSNFEIRSYALAVAVTDNRVLVEDGSEKFWAPRQCEHQNWQCWVKPLTHCRVPSNWRNENVSELTLGSDDRVMYLKSPLHANRYRTIHHTIHTKEWKNKPLTWHKAQLYGYLLRPSLNFTQTILIPIMKTVFRETKGIPPLNMIAMFIRQGDKVIEADIQTPDTFFDTLIPFADLHNLKHLYLGSDSKETIDYCVKKYSHRFKIYYVTNEWRRGGGFTMNVTKLGIVPELRKMADLTFVDLYISQYAFYFAGDLVSNHNRLIDALRKFNGKARFPYIPVGVYGLITEYLKANKTKTLL